MRVLKKAARIQRRQHTSPGERKKGHSLEFVCWCTTERYSGYLAGDCEFETRFLRQPAPLEKPGPGDEAIGGSRRRLILEDDDPFIGSSSGRCVSRRGEEPGRGSPLWGNSGRS